jgi:hypothetical protein
MLLLKEKFHLRGQLRLYLLHHHYQKERLHHRLLHRLYYHHPLPHPHHLQIHLYYLLLRPPLRSQAIRHYHPSLLQRHQYVLEYRDHLILDYL